MRKSLFLIFFLMPWSSPELFSQNESYLLGTTQHIKFQSNFWINMHHFLYQRASNLKRERSILQNEKELIGQLKGNDLLKFQKSMKFYKEHVIDQDLLFNTHLTRVKIFLSGFSDDRLPENTDIDKQLFIVLNEFRETYRKVFWSLHHSANQSRFDETFEIFKKIEPQVIAQLSKLTKAYLPPQKIVVDVTANANWAGAYTSDDPTHVVMSSTRTNPHKTAWVETIFHEISHGLISSETGFIGGTIHDQSKKLKKEVPENLWHAIIFYFAGKLTASALKEIGIDDHEMYMFRNNNFEKYHEVLNLYFPDYMTGKATFKEVIVQVLNHK